MRRFDERPPSGDAFDIAVCAEVVECLADGRAGKAEARAELLFGHELIADLEGSVDNGVAYGTLDDLVF